MSAEVPPQSAAPAATPPPDKRGGRDLPAAIGVGVGMGTAVVFSLVIERAVFVGLVALAMIVGIRELAGALGTRGIRPPVVPISIGAVIMLVAAYNGGTESLVVGAALTMLGVVVWRLPEGPDGYARDVTAGLFTTVYAPFLAGFAVLLDAPEDGAKRVATYVLLTVCNDVGGYCTGSKLGKHPMCPTVSPKKSWEGFAGSVLTCMAAGAVCLEAFFGEAWWKGVLIGAAAAVAATVGDLGESVLKRDIGVKDMGTLLPGHGGLMDRLDSLLVTAPVLWLLLSGLAPPG